MFARSLWSYVAAIYAITQVVLWAVSQRPGYVATDASVYAMLTRCWGACVRWNRWHGTPAAAALSAGEYVSVAPRVHTFQFIRNALFWAVVLGMKVRALASFRRQLCRPVSPIRCPQRVGLLRQPPSAQRAVWHAQGALDFFLVLSGLPDVIRGLLKQDWLGTCGADLQIASSNVPCVENLVLVAALLLPIFLVVLFDTGILYQERRRAHTSQLP